VSSCWRNCRRCASAASTSQDWLRMRSCNFNMTPSANQLCQLYQCAVRPTCMPQASCEPQLTCCAATMLASLAFRASCSFSRSLVGLHGSAAGCGCGCDKVARGLSRSVDLNTCAATPSQKGRCSARTCLDSPPRVSGRDPGCCAGLKPALRNAVRRASASIQAQLPSRS
jgi:hypothetical protein